MCHRPPPVFAVNTQKVLQIVDLICTQTRSELCLCSAELMAGLCKSCWRSNYCRDTTTSSSALAHSEVSILLFANAILITLENTEYVDHNSQWINTAPHRTFSNFVPNIRCPEQISTPTHNQMGGYKFERLLEIAPHGLWRFSPQILRIDHLSDFSLSLLHVVVLSA